jgi:pimeloyl-ACP methyl ester carboxylesterase
MAQLALIRNALRIVSVLSPRLGAHIAGRFWFRIPRPPLKESTRVFLATGHRFSVTVGAGEVACWRWGSGPVVMLVHGWGGFAGQLEAFVAPLVARGRQVIAFDAPSHGSSGAGQLGAYHATLFEFADALSAIAPRNQRIDGIIGHSGGCAAIAWAMWKHPDLRVERLVFVAPFGKPLRYMKLFQQTLGLSDRVMQRFRASTEQRFDFRWEELDVPAMASRMRTPPLLVLHDREDRETDWQDGADIAVEWPNARLETTTGLGHNRILRDTAVVNSVVEFLVPSS